jgi:hypothetical protein
MERLTPAETTFPHCHEIPGGATVREVRQWCLDNLGPVGSWSIRFDVSSQARRNQGPSWSDDYVPYVMTRSHEQHVMVVLAWGLAT